MPYDSGKVSNFPEMPRSSHFADESGKPHYIKGSKSVGAGHQDHEGRMEHPFGITPPNDESGEGKND